MTLERAIRSLSLHTDRPSTALEITVGRVLAACAHPVLAWRVLSPSGRLVVCGGYAAAAYLTVLTILMLRNPLV
jgi:hypothetical protein